MEQEEQATEVVIEKRKRSANVTPEMKSKMLELEAAGKTRRAIALETGYHAAVVTRQLGKKAKGIEPQD